MMETAVVFYSAHGSSALAAKALAAKLGAKLVELKEKKPRDLGKVNFSFMVAGMQATFRIKTRLQGQPWQDTAGCSELHIITPIWAAKIVPAMNTFVSKFDFKGKKVYLYTLQADSQDTAKPAREALEKLVQKKGGTIVGSHGLVGSAPGKEPNAELADKITSL